MPRWSLLVGDNDMFCQVCQETLYDGGPVFTEVHNVLNSSPGSSCCHRHQSLSRSSSNTI